MSNSKRQSSNEQRLDALDLAARLMRGANAMNARPIVSFGPATPLNKGGRSARAQQSRCTTAAIPLHNHRRN
jgi:hypothetical protein